MVVPWAQGVHVERGICLRCPAFPQAASQAADPRAPSLISELGNELRPDRDHPDKQRDRRQRGCFLDENLQHARLLTSGTYEEHCSHFVL